MKQTSAKPPASSKRKPGKVGPREAALRALREQMAKAKK